MLIHVKNGAKTEHKKNPETKNDDTRASEIEPHRPMTTRLRRRTKGETNCARVIEKQLHTQQQQQKNRSE